MKINQHLAKYTFIHIWLLLFYSGNIFPQAESFNDLLTETNMEFNMPENYIETKIIENEQQRYQHSMKHKTLKIEVRYFLQPLKIKSENSKSSDLNKTIKLPNDLFRTMSGTILQNITGTVNVKKSVVYTPQNAKKYFGADYAAGFMLFPPISIFGKGYKHITMQVLHKDNIGDVYIFCLFDDSKVYSNEYLSIR